MWTGATTYYKLYGTAAHSQREASMARTQISATLLLISLLFSFLNVPAFADASASISPVDAENHVGERATVCGFVASTKYAIQSRGAPTFLNLGKPYPNQIFTAVVWGNARSNLSYQPESLKGSSICVRGLISLYRGTPQIIVRDPSDISQFSH